MAFKGFLLEKSPQTNEMISEKAPNQSNLCLGKKPGVPRTSL